MILENISILNFKNISEANLEFSPKVNCFAGNNGMGKTNMLDAIYYLSFCKSYINQGDMAIVRHDSDYMMLQGKYQRKNEPEEISCGFQKGKRKILKRNGKEYKRLSHHIGLLPLVMVSPMDWELIRGAGEERRRLIDQIISQSNAQYLADLINYGKAVESRNALLKKGYTDEILFETLEEQICRTATNIHKVRMDWVKSFSPIFHDYYSRISDSGENVELEYRSVLNAKSMAEVLEISRQKDVLLGYTSQGIHRDDIELLLGGYSMRKTGSQGQCKTYTIALRLAQYDFLKEHSGVTPILLLDDIFDKLDASRVENIISIVADDKFGQIFITDTNRTYLDEIICRVGKDYKIYSVAGGICNEVKNSEQ